VAGSAVARAWRDAIVIAGIGLTLYLSSGTIGAYMARDDFQWLNGARDLPLSYTFHVEGRTHFYRPVAELWWFTSYRVCGVSTSCYHAIELATHLANTLLFFLLTVRVFGRRDVALPAAILFVVMPAYVQAVVWVCAVTTLFAAFWYLVCLHASLSAAARDRAGWYSAAAIAAGVAAVYTHESSATLVLTVPLMVALNPATRRYMPRTIEVLAGLALLAVFAYTTVVANERNYVFTSGHYTAGRHALAHGFDYIRALYIGRRAVADYVGVAAVTAAIVLRGTVIMRAGLAWTLLTMIPFLSFTWGNVGRYTYLPAMGFVWIVAAAAMALRDRVTARSARPVGLAVAYVVLAVVAIRFAAFSRSAIQGEVQWMDAYRAYARDVMSAPTFRPESGEVVVRPPDGVDVEREYVPPMLQWETGNSGLIVRFAND